MNILGCPVKISSQNTIYFPVNYMHVYGIDIYRDSLIQQTFENYLIFRPYCKRELEPNEIIITLRSGSTYLPAEWLISNHLTPGQDSLYLIGVDDGFIVSVSPKIGL